MSEVSQVTAPRREHLLVPMLDFPSEFAHESNLWFDYDHVPERLACDGIEWCERYEREDVEPAGWSPKQQWVRYLNIYTLSSVDVLDSEAYRLQRDMNGGRGSVWRQLRESRQRVVGQESPTRMLRTSWSRRPDTSFNAVPIGSVGPKSILVVLRGHAGEDDEALQDFLDQRFYPELVHVPGFLGCERFEAAGSLVGGATGSDRAIDYMDIIEIGSPEVVTSAVYRKFMREAGIPDGLRAAFEPTASGVYRQRSSPWLVSIR